mmetsp:Transcript_12704/g.38475  ORF Transcript_12704/g.38475 Transcript_12704/m.38475 type:complete len:309 (+) Transcript_12704:513-1439(+)
MHASLLSLIPLLIAALLSWPARQTTVSSSVLRRQVVLLLDLDLLSRIVPLLRWHWAEPRQSSQHSDLKRSRQLQPASDRTSAGAPDQPSSQCTGAEVGPRSRALAQTGATAAISASLGGRGAGARPHQASPGAPRAPGAGTRLGTLRSEPPSRAALAGTARCVGPLAAAISQLKVLDVGVASTLTDILGRMGAVETSTARPHLSCLLCTASASPGVQATALGLDSMAHVWIGYCLLFTVNSWYRLQFDPSAQQCSSEGVQGCSTYLALHPDEQSPEGGSGKPRRGLHSGHAAGSLTGGCSPLECSTAD